MVGLFLGLNEYEMREGPEGITFKHYAAADVFGEYTLSLDVA